MPGRIIGWGSDSAPRSRTSAVGVPAENHRCSCRLNGSAYEPSGGGCASGFMVRAVSRSPLAN
jgi:hypothetical protein